MAHDISAPHARIVCMRREGEISMSDEPTKPADASMPFSAQDAMAFMQRMWNPFSMPMPGSTAGAVMPTDPPGAPAPPAAAASPPAAPAVNAMSAMMGGVMPGMLPFPNPAAMFAALDPAEVERRIGELKVIEGWLAMSLNLMQMSIKTLELQRASLEAFHAGRAPAKKGEPKAKKG
jgi:hypothetical protein